MKRLVVSLLVLLGCLHSPGQESRKEVSIGFRVGSSALDTQFADNASALADMISFIDGVKADPNAEITAVEFCGSASPEGKKYLNERLASQRADNIRKYVCSHTALPDNLLRQGDCIDVWSRLAAYVERSDMKEKQQVLDELRNRPEYTYDSRGRLIDSRKKRLMEMNYGRTWNYMLREFFPSVRNASVVVISVRQKAAEPEKPDYTETPVSPSVPADTVVTPSPEPSTSPNRYFALKTNMLYDALAVPNIGVEFSLGKRWSLAADWMYGWWNNDSRHRYWRVYGGGITLRKWLGAKAQEKPLQGHHIGLNAQVLTYDFEFGGKGYMGGEPGGTLWDRMNYAIGAEYGYSLPVARRLNIDFGITVGYLGGRYYEYIPLDGHYVWQSTKQRHWVGPTKAEISLVWLLGHGNFNSKKKGGDK